MPELAAKTDTVYGASQAPSATLSSATPSAPARDFYIDRLRAVMTALVVLHHTAITYGASGGWFWNELKPSGTLSSLLLTMFVATNQAYFMGFFFLLAGYFTPSSLERKGYGQFLLDRFLRLGLPLLAFGLLLGPLTTGIVNAATGDGFWPCIQYLWNHREFINGPLWFAQALLIFSLAYCAWRAIFGMPLAGARRSPKPVPGYGWWLLSAVGTAVGALAIREFVPVGKNVFGLQLGYFAGYIFLFAVGIAARRHDWLRQLSWRNVRPWLRTLIIAFPAMPIGIAVARAFHSGGKADFSGGLSWPAILYAFWEPFVAWALIGAWLLLFRKYMNQPSPLWDWLNRRAYAVYIIHPPILVSISLALWHWTAPALIKFGVTGVLTCTACWLLSDPLVRIPGVRSIV
ncbi:acyltransferase [Acidicapsa dinghuensis]|uniref:Acyltransferase n=1 Tax=Acidicapsa dinghuensis TaxID=2218256 RepID=A0ABW1EJW0_9BACT|nr:acyltransferase [Acidicapsa dinghuensis]